MMDGLIARSTTDVDGVCRLLRADVVASSCPRVAPYQTPRLRINVSGQPFELPVALLARHPGNESRHYFVADRTATQYDRL